MFKVSFKTLALLCAMVSFTIYMTLNTAELLLELDLPVINAVATVEAHTTLETLELHESSTELNTELQGLPRIVRLPEHNIRLEVIQGTITESGLLARTNKVHYLVGNNREQAVLVLYAQKDWRTINTPDSIAQNENIYIDTDEWRYLYRVTQKYIVSEQSSYILPELDTQQMLFVIQDESAGTLYLLQCEYLDVQPII